MFHPKAGELVVLTNGNRTAQRSHPGQEFNNGLVMSLEPLRDNHLFEVRIDKKVSSWTGTIEIGVTTCDPNSLQFPMTAAMLPPVTWLVSGVSVLRDGQPIVEEYVQNLESLGEGDTVGVMKTSEGDLHFYVNGVDQGTAVMNIPAKVYAVIDLYGKCAQVTALETTNESRIHSNELSNISAVTSSMYNSRNSNISTNNNGSHSNNNVCGSSVDVENVSFDNATSAAVANESIAAGSDINLSTSDKLRFHERTGTLVKLTNCGRTAERSRPQDEFNNGVVMTHRPLRDNELFEIRIDRLVDKWSGSIEVGVTTHNPSSLEFPATMTNMRSGTIMMSGCGILTNGKGTRREYGVYNLDELMEGDCISLMRKGNGNLHYYINGIDQGVAASKVPITVFAVVDLYGMTVKVSIVDHDDRLEQGLANHRNNTLIREYHLLNGLATSDELDDERLLFDSRCGSHAAVINGGKSAHRPIAVEDFDNAVVLTSRPLRAGELFEVRLDAVVPKWAGSIEIGVTTHSPRLLDFPSTMTNLSSGNWMMTGKGVMHNGTATIEEYGQNLDRLTVGNRVGVLWKENGYLHFFVNGVDQGVAATNVPDKVFGVVDLYGQATRCTIVDHQESTYDSANAGAGPTSYSPSSELRFHYLRGRNARISSCGMIASRPKANVEFNDAIVISNRPLRDNEMFEVALDKMVDRWSGSIEAGVTAIKPDNLEFPSTMTDIDYDTWMLSGSAIMQNGSTIRNSYKCDLDSMEANTRVGMMRHADATLHYYVNGEDMGVACNDIPQNVYAVIDLYGQCAQVTIIPPSSMSESITSPPTHTETLRLSLGETTDATHHFSAFCGKNVIFSNNNVVATRGRGFNHGLVFSSAPLQSNELFEIQVQQVSKQWSGSLQIGLTTLHYVDGLPTSTLPCSASHLPETNGSDTWLLTGTRVRRNSIVLRDNFGPSLERLGVCDRVGVKRCTDGTMRAFYNGRDMGVAAVNLPKKLYAVVDLYGSAVKVAIVSKSCSVGGDLITPVETRDRRTSSHSNHSRDSLEDLGVHEFQEIHGRNIVLSNGNTAARRTASYNQGVVFSRKPLVKGQLFQLRIDRLNSTWNSSLLVGVTSHSPCRGTLPVTALDLRRSTWIVCGDSVFHNGVKVKARYGPNLDSLQARHVVGVMVDAQNQLHMYVNRLDQGVAAKDIPQPCYAVVDLYGQCEELTIISSDSPMNHVIDANHCEKANFEHGWKEKVSKPPFVDQVLVKNCHYQNACIRFKSSLGLPDGYFLPEHSICYCDTCYKIRGDEAYYRKGEPPKDYAVPFGWCQFSLRIPLKADSSGTLDKWHIAFHGTRPAIIRQILDCGDLLIPEEAGLCSVARNFTSKNKSKDVDDEAIQICFSPTIRYAANSSFTPKFEFVDSKTKRKSFARCAFQVLAQPGAYNSGPQRLGAREPIDGHFSNSDIEWFTKERGATILHSLLIRIEDSF